MTALGVGEIDHSPEYPAMLQSFYKSRNKDFTLIECDCVETLSRFNFCFDMVFADPPYFLSGGGISYQSGEIVSVDKGDWDKPKSPDEMDAFNLRWILFLAATSHTLPSLSFGLVNLPKSLIISITT